MRVQLLIECAQQRAGGYINENNRYIVGAAKVDFGECEIIAIQSSNKATNTCLTSDEIRFIIWMC